LYIGRHWDRPASEDEPGVVVNAVQNICLFVVHLLTEAPLRPSPRASCQTPNAKKWYVLSAQGKAKVRQSGQQLPGADGSMVDASAVQAWLEMGLGVGDSFEVTVESARKALEQCVEFKWEWGAMDLSVNDNVLSCAVYGFGATWVRRDRENWSLVAEEIQCKRVYPDPTQKLQKDWSTLVFDVLLWEDKAVRILPQHEALIRANAFSGAAPFSALGVSAQDWSYTDTINFYRRNVALRIGLWRHQRYPATVPEAVGRGLVTAGPGGGYILAGTDEGGAPGEETSPGAANWPIVYDAIREVMAVGTECFSDKRSDYADMNLIWNICRPVSGQPWGMGYAMLIADLNKTLDMMITIIKIFAQMYPWPMEIMPQSMADGLKNNEDQRRLPGGRIRVPDSLYTQTGKLPEIYVNPPTMPEGMFKFIGMLVEWLDKFSGHTEVSQGQGTPDAKAGIAIQELISAAKGIFSYLSKHTEYAVGQMGKIVREQFTRAEPDGKPWVPESEIGRILGLQDEPDLVRAYIKIWLRTPWVDDVESMAGTLQQRRQVRNEAIARYEAARPTITLESVLETCDDSDPTATAAKIKEENAPPMPVGPGGSVPAGPQPAPGS
jgi:hypothetical protein